MPVLINDTCYVALKLMLLQIVIHLGMVVHVYDYILQCALGPLIWIDLLFCQGDLLLRIHAIRLKLLTSCISDIRAGSALRRQVLHLIIQILVLMLVYILACLVNDCLCDAAGGALLLVVVESGVDPSLLTRPHV